MLPAPPPTTRIGRFAVIVDVAVAHPAAVAGPASGRAASRRRRAWLQLLEEVGEQRHVVGVDLRQLREPLAGRCRGARSGGALRARRSADRSGAHLARQLEGDDARDVGLERQQPADRTSAWRARPRTGHADGPLEVRQLGVVRAAARPSGCGARPRGPNRGTRRRLRDRRRRARAAGGRCSSVTESRMLRSCARSARAVGRRAAVAEQALEHHARIGFGRQRRRRRRPREGVL